MILSLQRPLLIAATTLLFGHFSGSLLASSPAHSGIYAPADTAEVAASNPAGMTRLEGTHKTTSAIVALGFGEFKVEESSNEGGDPDSDIFPVAVPGFFYVTSLSEDWRAGFSVTVPSGFGSTNGSDWAGRYYSDEFLLIYISMMPSVAYKITDNLSVGAGVSFTYNYSQSTVRVNNPDTEQDGKLEFDSGSFGVNASVSMLYEFSDRTRIGLSYADEATADLEGDLEFSRLGPFLDNALENLGLKDAEFEVESVLPQRLGGGIFHQMDDGSVWTADATWIDFSAFATGDISLNDLTIEAAEANYDDIWFYTLGYRFPEQQGKTYKLGIMHLTAPIDDEDRTLSLRMDRIWAVGAGVSFERKGRLWDISANIYDFGNAPVDVGTEDSPRGRIVGESENHYAISLDIAYHW